MDLKEPRPISASACSSERVDRRIRTAICALGFLLVTLGTGIAGETPPAPPSDPTTFVDHDGHPPIAEPATYEENLYRYYVRYGFVQPLADALDVPGIFLDAQEAANLNTFDEVPNSTWFTNRNHFRAMSPQEILEGPGHCQRPQTPWTIRSVKQEGVNPGFNIKDAAGEKWVVKFDPPGFPQIGSGAGVITGRLLHAAGYNVPHDVAVSFRREDLELDPELVAGKDGEPGFDAEDLDRLLKSSCAVNGRNYVTASLFLPGEPVGHVNMNGRRPDDPNDLYTHYRRRELRGLRILAAWLNHWDTKDQQSLDMFETRVDSLGTLHHYFIDLGATLGAAAEGPKRIKAAYEYAFDPGWIARRIATLGFIEEPWRNADQETEIPAVGNFEAEGFHPDDYRPMMPHLAFQECTKGDAYWGAKLVASFTDAQIAAAVEAAGYEDPKASSYILDALCKRRDVIARTWFSRVAPLDFFTVAGDTLHFRDLAVDRGLTAPRSYVVRVEGLDGGRVEKSAAQPKVSSPWLDLRSLPAPLTAVRLVIGVAGEDALPATVELQKSAGSWRVTRVRHA